MPLAARPGPRHGRPRPAAGPDVLAAFDGRRQHKVSGRHCGNLDVQIDAIHHRA